MIEQKELKEIGKFQKSHALKGELNALLDIAPEYVSEGNAIIIDVDGIYVPFYAESVRQKGSQSYLVKLDGVDSEADAKPFVNKIIYALKTELAPFLNMEEDEIVDDDFSGYIVIDDKTGIEIGKIVSVESSTANVLFVIETPSGDEVFIPAVEEFIVEIDDETQTIKMIFPEGLLDLNNKTEK
ncbi:MAG: 16S rRNA processing protein RimM [Bacteroides sp.]|nr:16S rRNA processing protein RimM [Bacteroides sp.]